MGASGEFVGKLRLASSHECLHFLVHGIVERGRLILIETLLPDLVGPLGGVEATVLGPLLKAGVIGRFRAIERGLEVGQGVAGAAEVVAGRVLLDRIDGLAIGREVEAFHEG